MERIKEYNTQVAVLSPMILTLSTRWEISKSTPPCPASQCHDVKKSNSPLSRAMNFGDFVDGKAQQPLPPSLAPHESELDEFQQYCHKLCLKILTLFAIGLEVSPPDQVIICCNHVLIILNRSIPRLEVHPGSHLVIMEVLLVAFFAFFTILPSQLTLIINLMLI
jgi:hypothetical protein